jgi:hypothetical protein
MKGPVFKLQYCQKKKKKKKRTVSLLIEMEMVPWRKIQVLLSLGESSEQAGTMLRGSC